jgi:hypothetical protein
MEMLRQSYIYQHFNFAYVYVSVHYYVHMHSPHVAMQYLTGTTCIYIYKSRRGKNTNLTALKSNSNTVWFNFQTYIIFSINLVSL